eukprot:SAG22_NODE_1009_length_6048_cov_7.732224_3_plen_171_part_00
MYNRHAVEARKKNRGSPADKPGRPKKLLPASSSGQGGVTDVVAPSGTQQQQQPRAQVAVLPRGHEYLANGTFRNVIPNSPTPSYLSSTTVFCGTILCHHRKPEAELGDYRVSSQQYVPEYKRVGNAVDEAKKGLLTVGGGAYVDPAVPASSKYNAFRPRHKEKELAKSTF